jgi:hypothetical protein
LHRPCLISGGVRAKQREVRVPRPVLLLYPKYAKAQQRRPIARERSPTGLGFVGASGTKRKSPRTQTDKIQRAPPRKRIREATWTDFLSQTSPDGCIFGHKGNRRERQKSQKSQSSGSRKYQVQKILSTADDQLAI